MSLRNWIPLEDGKHKIKCVAHFVKSGSESVFSTDIQSKGCTMRQDYWQRELCVVESQEFEFCFNQARFPW